MQSATSSCGSKSATDRHAWNRRPNTGRDPVQKSIDRHDQRVAQLMKGSAKVDRVSAWNQQMFEKNIELVGDLNDVRARMASGGNQIYLI
ncbi:MAG: hypothetical protein K0S38_1105 [Candidatus Paceibacter sp.]|nr:hypothetical protein [Candidatus Paceibacter sp.]